MNPPLSAEQDSLLKTYARQCYDCHLSMSEWDPSINSTFARRNPDIFLTNCANDAYSAILSGQDSWERIEKSVTETLARQTSRERWF